MLHLLVVQPGLPADPDRASGGNWQVSREFSGFSPAKQTSMRDSEFFSGSGLSWPPILVAFFYDPCVAGAPMYTHAHKRRYANRCVHRWMHIDMLAISIRQKLKKLVEDEV